MNKRKIGSHYENEAKKYLEQEGFQILEMNYRCKVGEIDIIAREGKYLVFVEVKFRQSSKMGSGVEAVNYMKQRKIIKAAQWYLISRMGTDSIPCRFDVLSIDGQKFRLLRAAFEA